MTTWRALTLKQPWPWAIVHAGKDVENRTWPVPPKLLKKRCRILACLERRLFHESRNDCERCSDTGIERLRVMIHAGKQWDKNAGPIAAKTFGNMKGSAWIGPGNVSVYYGDDGVVGSVWNNGLIEHSWTDPQPFSAVVAVAIITGQRQADSKGFSHYEENPTLSHVWEWLPMPTSPWEINEPHIWHWDLADVRPLTEPVPAKGRPGLWIPDTELIEAVEGHL